MSLHSSRRRSRETRSVLSVQSRLRAWSFGLAVVLGLAFIAYLWLGEFGDRGSLDRTYLPRAEGGFLLNPFDLNARKLVLFSILTASVLVIWRFERGREDRHDVLVLVGVLVMILGALNGSQGAGEMNWRMHGTIGMRDSRLDTCLLFGAVGALLVLAGFVRIALHRERRGALLGVCALFTLLWMSWVVHRFMMTPKWAQPMNAPGYVVQNLAQAPASDLLVYWTLEVSHDLVEIAERDGRAVPITGGQELDENELTSHVEELLAEAARWNDRRFQRAGLEVYIRAEATLSAKQVKRVLDRCAAAGAKRLELVTRKVEPWVTGRLEVYAPDPEIRAVLEVRAKADGTFSFLMGGREAKEVQTLLPRISHPTVSFPARQKIMVSFEPDLSWQEVVTILEEVDCFTRQVSIVLLEEE